ncbi:ABC transporter ATP-binding protein [Ancylobacter mangrovi]|uniref:ABC transporter ATP-binding protein n=1 Tax=Ancylobacter mangrovi TaxID=2972472 RepID=UPI002161A937|nr:ABC transporter ATP-binding protein [Ancylobacter mangrovi]MCS0503176.1 ATP-binding cassette domain-containing protein [Ancylobacter mangrovi]
MSAPETAREETAQAGKPVLEIRNISKTFHLPGAEAFKAVDDVSLSVHPGECVAIVGESGSGKSTVARMALSLLRPDSGQVFLEGRSLLDMSPRELRTRRLAMQPVFQDPSASFNPRRSVWSSLRQAIAQGTTPEPDMRARALELLSQVELRPPENYVERYPHELSGGQRQRLAIARALAPRPRLIIADEPLSGADVSIRAQILNLLLDLQAQQNIAFLLITHDMLVARALAQRVVVMHHGRIVEQGETEQVMQSPREAYTQRLLAAVLDVDLAPPPTPTPTPASPSAPPDSLPNKARSA